MGVGTFGKTWYGYFGRRLVFFVAPFAVRIIGLGFILQDFAFDVWMWLLLIPCRNGYGAAVIFN